MADVIVESDEEEFDETNSQLISEKKKHPYIRQTRDLSTKPKKQKLDELEVDQSDSEEEDDEENDDKVEEEEDDFARQLRLEKEEMMRKEAAAKIEKKTKIDPDGTEYEWDPEIKGWFPKVLLIKFLNFYHNIIIVNLNFLNY
jgi:hypothetical protein